MNDQATTKLPYEAPAVHEMGSVAHLTQANAPKAFADVSIPNSGPLTSS
jgi:hypothetical protein